MTAQHAFRPTDLRRDRCADCDTADMLSHLHVFDDTANHGASHDGLRAPALDGWFCFVCLGEREADRITGMPTTPELDAMAALPLDDDAVAELAAALGEDDDGPAPRIPVRPAGSLPDPYATWSEWLAGATWSALLTRANDDRRARARLLTDGPTDDLAGRACRWGLVPHAAHGWPFDRFGAEGAQRRREAAAVFGSWRHLADCARQLAATGDAGHVTTSVYRGSDAAEIDAGDERCNVTAVGGRWFYELPPIYRVGSDTGAFETEQDAYAPIPD